MANTEYLTQINALQDRTARVYMAMAQAGQLALKGTVDIDRTIRAQVAGNAQEAAKHAKSIMSAKDLKTVGQLHADFLRNGADKLAADTREVMELARARAREAAEPLLQKAG